MTAFENIVSVLREKAKKEHTQLSDIRVLANENPKKAQDSIYWKYIEKTDEETREYFKHNFFGNKETKAGVVQRLQTLRHDKLFWQLFSSKGQKLDFWKWLHDEKKTVVITSRGLDAGESTFLRFMIMQCIGVANRRRQMGLTEDQCDPIQLWVDEAQIVLQGKTQIQTITTQMRKFGLFLRSFTQKIGLIEEGADILIDMCNVKIGANLGHTDARKMANEMNCVPDLLQRRTPPSHFEYQVYAAGHTDKPVTIQLNKGPWDRWPKADNRQLVATLRLSLQGEAPLPSPTSNHEEDVPIVPEEW
jgi:hypothetical protein